MRVALRSVGTYFFANAARYMAENEHLRIVGLEHGDRASTVGGLAGLEIQQHLAMKLRAEPLGFLSGTVMAEDLAASAQWQAQEIGHVLDDAEHRRSDLLEHVEAFVGASGACWAIINCSLPVPNVDQLAPINLTQHLLQRAHDHRGTPDHGVSLGTRKPVDIQRSS